MLLTSTPGQLADAWRGLASGEHYVVALALAVYSQAAEQLLLEALRDAEQYEAAAMQELIAAGARMLQNTRLHTAEPQPAGASSTVYKAGYYVNKAARMAKKSKNKIEAYLAPLLGDYRAQFDCRDRIGTVPRPCVSSYIEAVDQRLARLLRASRLVVLRDRWLQEAYLGLKDDQALWDRWKDLVLQLCDGLNNPEAERIRNALRVASGGQLHRALDETSMRRDEDLCTIRRMQLDCLELQRNITGPRRARQMQATQALASVSLRVGFKADDAKARKGKSNSSSDSADGAKGAGPQERPAGSPPQPTAGAAEPLLTREAVLGLKKDDLLKTLAASPSGHAPWGTSKYTKRQWQELVLRMFSFEPLPAPAP